MYLYLVVVEEIGQVFINFKLKGLGLVETIKFKSRSVPLYKLTFSLESELSKGMMRPESLFKSLLQNVDS